MSDRTHMKVLALLWALFASFGMGAGAEETRLLIYGFAGLIYIASFFAKGGAA